MAYISVCGQPRSCRDMRGRAWACLDMHEVCVGVCGHVRVCAGVCGRAWTCMGMHGIHKCVRVTKIMQGHAQACMREHS